MPTRSFRTTEALDTKIDELQAAGYGNVTQIVTAAVERMYRDERTKIMTQLNATHTAKSDALVIVWLGIGWYAPRQKNGEVRYYFCGDSAMEPETYTHGLGTPEWFEAPPADWETK